MGKVSEYIKIIDNALENNEFDKDILDAIRINKDHIIRLRKLLLVTKFRLVFIAVYQVEGKLQLFVII